VNREDPSSKDKFLRLRDAYSVLSSTELRREYDLQHQRTLPRARSQTYRSDFTGTFVPPRQSYYRFVVVIALHHKVLIYWAKSDSHIGYLSVPT